MASGGRSGRFPSAAPVTAEAIWGVERDTAAVAAATPTLSFNQPRREISWLKPLDFGNLTARAKKRS